MDNTATVIIVSENIFKDGKFVSGFVALADGEILYVGQGPYNHYMSEGTRLVEAGERIVCPGLIDTHCFFSGFALQNWGEDLSSCGTVKEVVDKFSNLSQGADDLLVGRHTSLELLSQETELEKAFSSVPTILYSKGNETCWVNDKVKRIFNFDGTDMSSEAQWAIIKEIMQRKESVTPLFKQYMDMLNERGITAVKEMGFDDYYGFAEILKLLEEDRQLSLRIHFMSQPVSESLNIGYAQEMRHEMNSSFLKFSGFNKMIDGSISEQEADLKRAYENGEDGSLFINYSALEEEVIRADEEGFRFSLHAQGDGAVSHAVAIFNKCKKDDSGRLVQRHAITDLELTDPSDIARMAELGVVAEIYPQIMSIYPDSKTKISLINDKVGGRARFYWNRRKMQEEGVVISCATDLPLVLPNLGHSIYNTCFGKFDDGTAFNEENTLSFLELLKAWTYGGAYNLGWENKIGTLEKGKRADIIILDRALKDIREEDIRELKVDYTILDGEIIFERKR